MPKLFLRYPDGLFGVTLLLLRFTNAAITIPAFARAWHLPVLGIPFAVAAAAVATGLLLGLATRASALILLLALIFEAFHAGGELALFLTGCAGGAMALALLGPGAFSIDARLYGRRVIRLEPRSPERGGGG